MTVMVDMKIAPADRNGLYFNQDFVIFDLWLRDFSNLNQAFSFSVFHHCFHFMPSFQVRRTQSIFLFCRA